MRIRLLLPGSLIALVSGCATMSVSIPESRDGKPVLSAKVDKPGYLDLMALPKFAGDEAYPNNTSSTFKVSIRPDEKGALWRPVGEASTYDPQGSVFSLMGITPTDQRFSLPPGKYVLRVDANRGVYMKDIPLAIEPGKYTMVFCHAE